MGSQGKFRLIGFLKQKERKVKVLGPGPQSGGLGV